MQRLHPASASTWFQGSFTAQELAIMRGQSQASFGCQALSRSQEGDSLQGTDLLPLIVSLSKLEPHPQILITGVSLPLLKTWENNNCRRHTWRSSYSYGIHLEYMPPNPPTLTAPLITESLGCLTTCSQSCREVSMLEKCLAERKCSINISLKSTENQFGYTCIHKEIRTRSRLRS